MTIGTNEKLDCITTKAVSLWNSCDDEQKKFTTISKPKKIFRNNILSCYELEHWILVLLFLVWWAWFICSNILLLFCPKALIGFNLRAKHHRHWFAQTEYLFSVNNHNRIRGGRSRNVLNFFLSLLNCIIRVTCLLLNVCCYLIFWILVLIILRHYKSRTDLCSSLA